MSDSQICRHCALIPTKTEVSTNAPSVKELDIPLVSGLAIKVKWFWDRTIISLVSRLLLHLQLLLHVASKTYRDEVIIQRKMRLIFDRIVGRSIFDHPPHLVSWLLTERKVLRCLELQSFESLIPLKHLVVDHPLTDNWLINGLLEVVDVLQLHLSYHLYHLLWALQLLLLLLLSCFLKDLLTQTVDYLLSGAAVDSAAVSHVTEWLVFSKFL